MILLNLFLTIGLAHAQAGAPKKATLSFTAQTTVYQCPPGAEFPIMECKVLSDETKPVILAMDSVGDDDFQGSWDAVQMDAHFSLLATTFTNQSTGRTLSLDFNVGFDSDEDVNPGTYFEAAPAHPPFDLIVDGTRKPSGAYEILPELTISNLKYREK